MDVETFTDQQERETVRELFMEMVEHTEFALLIEAVTSRDGYVTWHFSGEDEVLVAMAKLLLEEVQKRRVLNNIKRVMAGSGKVYGTWKWIPKDKAKKKRKKK